MTPAQQLRGRRPMRRTSPVPPQRSPSSMVMPFDHAATFDLKGIPGNIVQDVINISSEGTFVAVAIGYGFEEDRGRAVALVNPPAANTTFKPGNLLLSQ